MMGTRARIALIFAPVEKQNVLNMAAAVVSMPMSDASTVACRSQKINEQCQGLNSFPLLSAVGRSDKSIPE